MWRSRIVSYIINEWRRVLVANLLVTMMTMSIVVAASKDLASDPERQEDCRRRSESRKHMSQVAHTGVSQ
jgi:hypothetical protein